ncbi:hypothetical protein LAB1_56350 [Roseibium sp. LAB1]
MSKEQAQMIDPETGLVISYSFLWSRENAKGEEQGRKARPTCVVVPLTSKSGDVVLFPLTTKDPGVGRLCLRVPETERKRLKLRGDTPCWILLDEANTDILPGSFHVEPISYDPLTISYGKFSHAFVGQILKKLAEAIRAKRLNFVQRER